VTASASKTEPLTLLYSGAHDTCGEALSDLLAHAVDAADYRPLDSMVAAIGVGRDNRLNAALSTRAYAAQLPPTNEAFTKALPALLPPAPAPAAPAVLPPVPALLPPAPALPPPVPAELPAKPALEPPEPALPIVPALPLEPPATLLPLLPLAPAFPLEPPTEAPAPPDGSPSSPAAQARGKASTVISSTERKGYRMGNDTSTRAAAGTGSVPAPNGD
jgi:hypothetical protein